MRLIMAPFAHSLFTTFFGIGVWFALQHRNALAKVGYVVLGYLVAVIMHGLWNGSSLLGIGAYFGVYLLWMVPIFGLVIWLGVASRRKEQRITAEKLPGMVAAGLLTSNEATWLGSIRNRKAAVAQAARAGGKPAAKSVKTFAHQVVELAFVRDRIDRGFGDARVNQLLTEETYGSMAHVRLHPRCRRWRDIAQPALSAPPYPSCGRIRPTPPTAHPAGRRCPSCRGPAFRPDHVRPGRPRTAIRRAPAAASVTSARRP